MKREKKRSKLENEFEKTAFTWMKKDMINIDQWTLKKIDTKVQNQVSSKISIKEKENTQNGWGFIKDQLDFKLVNFIVQQSISSF